MAISGVTTDYTGRRKDISILRTPDARLVGAQTVAPAFGRFTAACAGVQKLIQRYTVILLTNLASQPDFPEFGTALLYTLRAGITADKLHASQVFNLASYAAVRTLKDHQAEHPEIPPDERIAGAELTEISLYGGFVGFGVTIKTEAGDSVVFLVPLPE